MLTFSDIVREINKGAAVAAKAPHHPEGKLRELVGPLWEQYIRERRIDLTFQPREERTLANGRADTVFNRLILEYKKPGTIKPENAKNRRLISQVQGYVEDLAREERWKEQRLLGVAFDGRYFLFIRAWGAIREYHLFGNSAHAPSFGYCGAVPG